MRNLEAIKVKKCGSEKKKETGTHTIFPLLAKSAVCAKLFFTNSIDFFCCSRCCRCLASHYFIFCLS